MHLGGLLRTQDARVAQFYYFPSSILISLLLHNFIISLPPPHLFYMISNFSNFGCSLCVKKVPSLTLNLQFYVIAFKTK